MRGVGRGAYQSSVFLLFCLELGFHFYYFCRWCRILLFFSSRCFVALIERREAVSDKVRRRREY
jgi:hypothetical protein